MTPEMIRSTPLLEKRDTYHNLTILTYSKTSLNYLQSIGVRIAYVNLSIRSLLVRHRDTLGGDLRHRKVPLDLIPSAQEARTIEAQNRRVIGTRAKARNLCVYHRHETGQR